MIKFTIIIPVYNEEKFLNQCLDSVLNQTYKNLEIICIDDCSTDNSYEILKEYQNKDSRIVLMQNPQNNGPGETKNFGLNNATGDFVHFLDSDDWLELNTYEKLAKEIENNPDIDLIQFGHKTISNKTRQIKGYYNSLNYQNPNFIITPKTKIYFCTGYCSDKLFKLKLLTDHQIHFSNYPCYEDNIVSILSTIYSKNMKFADGYFYNYRVDNESSITGLYNNPLDFFFKYFLELAERTKAFEINYRNDILIREYSRIYKHMFDRYIHKEIKYNEMKNLIRLINFNELPQKLLNNENFSSSIDILNLPEPIFLFKTFIKSFLKNHLPNMFKSIIKIKRFLLKTKSV